MYEQKSWVHSSLKLGWFLALESATLGICVSSVDYNPSGDRIVALEMAACLSQMMQHDSDDSSVPANLDPFGIKPLGFNGYPVYLCCI